MLRVERDGDVLVLTIDRPNKMNALDEATLRSIASAMKEDARAIVITGNGAFCAGGDLEQLRDKNSADDARALSDLGFETMRAIEETPCITIAAIDGIAFGGGAELAMACDVRIAGDRARISFKQAMMGATTSWGTSARLLRTLGHGAASLLLLTAIEVDADRACALRLCEMRAPDAKSAALDLARKAAKCKPGAVRELKSLLRAGGAREDERAAFIRAWSSPEHAAAVEEYFARKPDRRS